MTDGSDREQRRFVRDLVRPAFALGPPAYVLDMNFRFLEWNAAFYELCARPLNLAHGTHVQNFVARLENGQESIQRAMNVFGLGKSPVADTEPLLLKSERFGNVLMQKMATLVFDPAGRPSAWIVTLAIRECERANELFAVLKDCLTEESLWSAYGLLYENLEQRSVQAKAAVERVIEQARMAKRILCVGLSTGWEIAQLRRAQPGSELVICEPCLSVKESILRLNDGDGIELLPNGLDDFRGLHEASFEAVISFGGLPKTRSPDLTAAGIARVLEKGGVFAALWLRPHAETARLMSDLQSARRDDDNDLLENYRAVFRQVEPSLNRDSTETWEQRLKAAGLKIQVRDEAMLFEQGVFFLGSRS